MFYNDTPIETYTLKRGKHEYKIHVKREDLFAQDPAPHVAKLRGLNLWVKKQSEKGVKCIGALDTRGISKSAWGLACCCQGTDIKPLAFYPQLKVDSGLHINQQKAKDLGAEIIPLSAGRYKILYSRAKKIVEGRGGIMLPEGIKLRETVSEVAKTVGMVPKELLTGSIVICSGTGTITAGLIKGLIQNNAEIDKLYVVSCGMSINKQLIEIKKLLVDDDFLPIEKIPEYVQFIPPRYNYYEPCEISVPFPCSTFYDKKAWQFMSDYIYGLKAPLIFWNIGD